MGDLVYVSDVVGKGGIVIGTGRSSGKFPDGKSIAFIKFLIDSIC